MPDRRYEPAEVLFYGQRMAATLMRPCRHAFLMLNMTVQTAKNAVRDSNIELLRIVLMLMIIGYHLIVHGAEMAGSVSNYQMVDKSAFAYVFLKSFLVIAVNCFVFISGFYRIRFKVHTVLGLLFQVLFYSLLLTLVGDIFSLRYVNLGTYVRALFPLFTGMWWFITAYLALYLLSPLLNTAIDSLSKQRFLFVIISITLLISVFDFAFGADVIGARRGQSLISFIHIYLIGQYISRWVDHQKLERHALPAYITSSLLIFLLACLSIYFSSETGVRKTFAYNNPLVVFSAISFFFCFKRIHFRSRAINSISPYVLGIYLFHDHPLVRTYLIETLYNLSQNASAFLHFLSLLAITFLVYLIGLLIDRVRSELLIPLTAYLIDRFGLLRIERMIAYRR